MPTPRQRKNDTGLRKRIPLLHYLAAFVIGWHFKGWFPDTAMIIDLIGDGWTWFIDAIQGLGGLAVITSATVVAWNIYKEYQARKAKK
jgi:hypothetical protein